MKNKVLKIILIFILIILVLFIINLFRKAFIIDKFSRKFDEYQDATNFYAKIKFDDSAEELWRKDNIGITKYIKDNDERMMYVNGDEIWTLTNTENSDGNKTKIAVKMKNETSYPFLPILEDGTLYSENFWQALFVSLTARVSTEMVDEKECYKVYFQEDFQIFINKEDYFKIKEINTGTTKEVVEYKLNCVTDSDIEFPNLDGYEIKEAN